MNFAMLPRDEIQREVEASHKRIAELEAALDEIRGAAFEMSRVATGTVQIMCVPIGAWQNAMRFIGEPREQS